MLREWVAAVAAGKHLTEDEAAAAMREMVSGEASPALAAALLTALKIKGEQAEEVAGFARGMREHAERISPRCERLVDTCGTGGGTVPTFNISTAAAFVVAGAGVSVAKHGNRAITSRCGSADVLEALGVRIDLPATAVCACIEETGIGFLFAQAHHPAMRHVNPVRRELPFRTIFNCLGPLTNPAGARTQVIGVYDRALVHLLAGALQRLGAERALIVHGLNGLDELSTLGLSQVADLRNGEIRTLALYPEQVGLPLARPDQLAPGEDAAASAALIRAVLAGEPGPRREIVLLNAAAALLAAGAVEHSPDLPTALRAGIQLAAESIDSGAAQQKLEQLISATRS